MSRPLSTYTEEWAQLAAMGIKRTYKPGEIIHMQGEKNIGLFCITQGKIKNFVCFSDGTEKVMAIMEAPAITGETSVLDNRETMFSAQALVNTEVIVVPAKEVLSLMQRNFNFMMLLLEVCAEKIRCLELQAESVVLNTQQKLARMLINFYSYGIFSYRTDKKVLLVTHEQLAGFLGTTRPKITSTLSMFEAQGLIRRRRGVIEILDEISLKAIFE